MGYEERMYAMSENNSEQQIEGRCEVVHRMYEHFKNATQQNWTKEEILEVISDFDG